MNKKLRLLFVLVAISICSGTGIYFFLSEKSASPTESMSLKKRYEGRRFFLEIELSELEGPGQKLRIRRKQFYLRNGMKETGVKVCLFQIPMELLTDGQDMVFEEYHEFYEQTIGPVFARKVERL